MTEGHSLMDQARRVLIGFKTREELFLSYSYLLISLSSPLQRLEMANQIMDWLELWGSFFPQSPLTFEIVEAERQRAMEEIGPLFHHIPGGPDSMGQLLSLLAPDPIQLPVPVPEEREDELSLFLVPVLEQLMDELPPLPVPVPERFGD
ncbi:hypothetical protein XENOCAPTIV_018581 [Xenoophorus captivus]|uniref:Uncharacterized protein n=1 Tax=Xenoophorus captivus TaxID=1517983 RepID=A0ABV0R9X2_9TELE